jgi:hypothetical protein
MRLFQMTTRRWMTAVAIAGFLLGAVVCGRRVKQRHAYYLQKAANCDQMDRLLRTLDPSRVAVSCGQVPAIVVDGRRYQAETVAEYNAELKRIYLRAASRPWLSVPAEPPPFSVLILGPFDSTNVKDHPSGIQIRETNGRRSR